MNQCGNDPQREQYCTTDAVLPSGSSRPNDPLGTPCEGVAERSQYIRRGEEAILRSFYTTCKYIVFSDVPNDYLGPIRNMRDVLAGLKTAVHGTEQLVTDVTTGLAQTLKFDRSQAGAGGVGVLLTVNYSALTAIAQPLSIDIAGFVKIAPKWNVVGGPEAQLLERHLKVRFIDACKSIRMFIPFAAPAIAETAVPTVSETFPIWGPIGGLLAETTLLEVTTMLSEITLSALPVGGNVTAQLVGPYASVWADVAGMLNAG